jgi:hypothetical protein
MVDHWSCATESYEATRASSSSSVSSSCLISARMSSSSSESAGGVGCALIGACTSKRARRRWRLGCFLLVFLYRFCGLSRLLRRLRLISRLVLGCLRRGSYLLFRAVERVLQFQMTCDKADNCIRKLCVELRRGSGESHRGGEGSIFAVRQLLGQDIDADLIFFERSDRQENGPLAQEWNELLKYGHLDGCDWMRTCG